jgi:hypothetical protein
LPFDFIIGGFACQADNDTAIGTAISRLLAINTARTPARKAPRHANPLRTQYDNVRAALKAAFQLLADKGIAKLKKLAQWFERDRANGTILAFEYKDGWYDETDGLGFSLVILDAGNSDLDSWYTAEAWAPSAAAGGSPGVEG